MPHYEIGPEKVNKQGRINGRLVALAEDSRGLSRCASMVQLLSFIILKLATQVAKGCGISPLDDPPYFYALRVAKASQQTSTTTSTMP